MCEFFQAPALGSRRSRASLLSVKQLVSEALLSVKQLVSEALLSVKQLE